MPLDADLMKWFWNRYLSEESDGDSPYASVLRAEDHSGLPPALVITAEQDPLTSEAEAYAEKLRDAGVPVEHAHYEGTMHEFFSMPMVIDKAREAINLAADGLRSGFEGIAAGGAATVGSQLREEMQVVGSDEEGVGRVKEVRENDFLVDRSALRLQRDLYVPFDAIQEVDDDRGGAQRPSGSSRRDGLGGGLHLVGDGPPGR